ncbi:MAG: formate dehydrogenase [Desulfobacteraceae bacterium]|jgi:formate dehydrogenase iron-sulfur subunit|nr:formate dehydrogenase [Desulfobacteraceae bacterium]MBC2749114.1 formate dehydrogenase [Desulfobacteraceae bacterium]
MSNGFFIDVTRCIACKACQIACKQWNNLPAEQTTNVGSYQNPPDFSAVTYKLVRMTESIVDGKFYGLYFPDQCRHCLLPPCLLWAQDSDAIYQDKDTGAVVYTSETQKLKAEDIIGVCPYDVPRRGKDGLLAKCTMCNDRVKRGMEPACVKTCPTDALNFGKLEEMQALASERLEKIKSIYPDAQLLDADDVRVIFLTAFAPQKYHRYAAAFDARPRKTR